jgi:hypothetical protein
MGRAPLVEAQMEGPSFPLPPFGRERDDRSPSLSDGDEKKK